MEANKLGASSMKHVTECLRGPSVLENSPLFYFSFQLTHLQWEFHFSSKDGQESGYYFDSKKGRDNSNLSGFAPVLLVGFQGRQEETLSSPPVISNWSKCSSLFMLKSKDIKKKKKKKKPQTQEPKCEHA